MHYVKDKGERVQRRRGGWAKGRTGKGREKKKKTRTTHNRNVGGHGCRCSPQRPLPSVKRLLLPLIGPADILTLRGVSSRVPPLPHPGTQRERAPCCMLQWGAAVWLWQREQQQQEAPQYCGLNWDLIRNAPFFLIPPCLSLCLFRPLGLFPQLNTPWDVRRLHPLSLAPTLAGHS